MKLETRFNPGDEIYFVNSSVPGKGTVIGFQWMKTLESKSDLFYVINVKVGPNEQPLQPMIVWEKFVGKRTDLEGIKKLFLNEIGNTFDKGIAAIDDVVSVKKPPLVLQP